MALICEYAVLRVSPDARRGETVNVGLVIFRGKRVDVRVSPDLSKVLALDPSMDIERLRAIPLLVGQWTKGVSDERTVRDVLSSTGLVSMTDKGVFTSRSAANYEDVIATLMERLVTPRPQPKKTRDSAAKLITTLKARFRSQRILGRKQQDLARHLVVHNFPIDEDEGLCADFMLKNGMYRQT